MDSGYPMSDEFMEGIMELESNGTKTVYLAGPILHRQDYGRKWREWLKQEGAPGGLEWLDPMDSVDNTDEPVEDWDIEEIVETDLREIQASDAMLVNWEAVPTAGTPMEIFYAYRVAQIPIVIRTELGRNDISPWIMYHASAIERDWEDAIKRVEELLHEPVEVSS